MEDINTPNTATQVSSPVQIQESREKSPLMWIVIILLILFVLTGGLLFFLLNNKPDARLANTQEENTKKQTQSIVEKFEASPLQNWTAPAKALHLDTAGNLTITLLDGSGTYTVALKGPSRYYTFANPGFSIDGKYVMYLVLPQSVIEGFEKEPPYEFHGSDEYELHLVDITNPDSPIDTVIARGVYYGLGSPPLRWKSNEILVYSRWNTETSKEEVLEYNTSQKTSKILTETPNHYSYYISPSMKYYSYFTIGKPQTNTMSISSYYNLYIGDISTGKEEIAYQDILAAEMDAAFLDDDRVIVTRENFARETISDCYVELVRISTKNIQEIDMIECPPGSSYTNIHSPRISPDGQYLATLYSENPFEESTSKTLTKGSAFIYDLETLEKKIVLEKPYWLGGIMWLSSDELIVYTSGAPAPEDSKEAFLYNIKTGTLTPHPILTGKEILSII